MSILNRLWRSTRFVAAYASANLQAAMEYRSAFIMQVVTMVANDSLWLFFWLSYFHQFPLNNGWQLTDIVILWAVCACGFGLSVSIFGNAGQLAALINTGALDAYLGMPRNVLLHVCVAATNPTGWGDVVFSVAAYLLLVRPDLWHLVLYIVLVLLIMLIFTAFQILLGCLAFFIGNTEAMGQQILGSLISFSTYPMAIFHGVVKLLLFTLLPAGFISFLPLQLLHRFQWSLFGAMVGATLIFVLLAFGLFRLGLRRYESGNLLGMQS